MAASGTPCAPTTKSPRRWCAPQQAPAKSASAPHPRRARPYQSGAHRTRVSPLARPTSGRSTATTTAPISLTVCAAARAQNANDIAPAGHFFIQALDPLCFSITARVLLTTGADLTDHCSDCSSDCNNIPEPATFDPTNCANCTCECDPDAICVRDANGASYECVCAEGCGPPIAPRALHPGAPSPPTPLTERMRCS